jgi:hypothetical protein
MRSKNFVWIILIGVTLFSSCNNAGRQTGSRKIIAENKIVQKEDGTISLKIDNAECYHDMTNPASNTAEWNVVISKSGRYKVWLSSATKDTTNMHYQNSVKLSIHDNQLETLPVCDRVFQNSNDVSRPYYRADSFMGSLYIQDTGVYSIQVISEKIIPKDYKTDKSSDDDQTKLLSVFLTPVKK